MSAVFVDTEVRDWVVGGAEVGMPESQSLLLTLLFLCSVGEYLLCMGRSLVRTLLGCARIDGACFVIRIGLSLTLALVRLFFSMAGSH